MNKIHGDRDGSSINYHQLKGNNTDNDTSSWVSSFFSLPALIFKQSDTYVGAPLSDRLSKVDLPQDLEGYDISDEEFLSCYSDSGNDFSLYSDEGFYSFPDTDDESFDYDSDGKEPESDGKEPENVSREISLFQNDVPKRSVGVSWNRETAKYASKATAAAVSLVTSATMWGFKKVGSWAITDAIETQISQLTQLIKEQEWNAEDQKKLAFIDPENQLDAIANSITPMVMLSISKHLDERGKNVVPYERNKLEIKEFLNVYIAKILRSILGHIAVSSGEIPAEPKQLLLVNITKGLFKAIHENISKEDLKYIKQQQALCKALSGNEQKKIAEELQTLIAPLTSKLLENAGITSFDDLQLNGVWSTWGLSKIASFFYSPEAMVSNVILELVQNLEFTPLVENKNEALKDLEGYDKLEAIVNLGVDKGINGFHSSLKKSKGKFAEIIVRQLTTKNILNPSYASIEDLLSYLGSEDDIVVSQFWDVVKTLSFPRLLNLLQIAAQANSMQGDRADNIFQKLFLGSIKAVYTSIKDKNEVLDAKVVAYEKFDPFIQLLGSAEKYFVDNEDALKNGLTSLRGKSRLEVEAFMDSQIEAILQTLSEKEKNVAAATAQDYFKKSSTAPVKDIFRKMFFGWEQDSNSLNLKATYKDLRVLLEEAKKRQFNVLGGTFGGLEEAILEVLGVETKEKWALLQLPGLDLKFVKTTLLPPLLLDAYRGFKSPSEGSGSSIELSALLVDAPEQREILLDILRRGNKINAHDKKFLEECGIADSKELIEGSFNIIARDLRGILCDKLESKEEISKLVKPILSDFKELDEKTVDLLIQSISAVASPDDPIMKELFDFFQKTISTILLKVLVNIGKNTEAVNPSRSNKQLIGAALLEISKKLNEHKENIYIAMRKPKEPGTEEFKDVFRPVVEDIMALTGLNAQDLPGAFGVNETLWTLLTGSILPELVGKAYCFIGTLNNDAHRAAHEEIVKRIYGTSHPREAMRAIAAFCVEFGQSFLSINFEGVANTAYDKFGAYLKRGGNSELVKNLERNREAVQQILGSNIASIMKPGETINGTLTSAKKYVEAILLTVFSNFSENIDFIDKNKDAHFFQDTVFDILKSFHSHVKKINEVTVSEKKTDIKNVDATTILKSFTDPKAEERAASEGVLPNLTELPEYQEAKIRLESAGNDLWAEENALIFKNKKKIKLAKQELAAATEAFENLRTEKFFKPLTKKILNFLKLIKERFPEFTEPTKEQLWSPCEEILMPTVLNNAFHSLMKPQTMNSLLLAAITAIGNTLKAIPEPSVAAKTDDVAFDEAISGEDARSDKDVRNDRLCGHIVSELLSLLPTAIFSTTIFDLKPVREATDPVLGDAVRKAFEQVTMAHLIDTALVKGLPSLLPGTEWRLEDGASPGQETFRFSVDEGRSGASRSSFGLPLTKESQQIDLKKRQMAEAAMPSELKEKLVRFLSEQALGLIGKTWKDMSEPWRKFCASVEDKVREKFGRHAASAVKKFIDDISSILRLVFDYSFGVIFNVFWIFVMERWYFDKQADEIINSLTLPIHEHFFFDVVIIVIKALEDELKKGSIKPLV